MPTIHRGSSGIVAALLAALLAGCASNGEQEDAKRTRADTAVFEQREEIRAPIDETEIVDGEAGYALRIVSGLPNGCAQFQRIDVLRSDPELFVDVWNSMPADDTVVCTMVYGTAENTVDLGDDFTPGRTYTVVINRDTRLEFAAQ